MALLSFRTSSYSSSIYILGSNTFQTIPSEYVDEVKKYAASRYSDSSLHISFNNGYITKEEWDQTLALKYPDGIPDSAYTA